MVASDMSGGSRRQRSAAGSGVFPESAPGEALSLPDGTCPAAAAVTEVSQTIHRSVG